MSGLIAEVLDDLMGDASRAFRVLALVPCIGSERNTARSDLYATWDVAVAYAFEPDGPMARSARYYVQRAVWNAGSWYWEPLRRSYRTGLQAINGATSSCGWGGARPEPVDVQRTQPEPIA